MVGSKLRPTQPWKSAKPCASGMAPTTLPKVCGRPPIPTSRIQSRCEAVVSARTIRARGVDKPESPFLTSR